MAGKRMNYPALEKLLGQQESFQGLTNRTDRDAVKAILRNAVTRELTQRQAQCVLLYFYENMTEEQVAKELGISKSVVCRHLQRAKRKLEKTISYAAAVYRQMKQLE